MMYRKVSVIVLYSCVVCAAACAAADSGEPSSAEPVERAESKAPPPKAAADPERSESTTPPQQSAKPASDAHEDPAKSSSNAPALRAEIQDESGRALSDLNVDCSGKCLTIAAAAVGGNGPYTFTWEDGSHDPKREVCPRADTHITLEARDTALMTAEFTLEAQHASAQLELRVQGCAGVAEAAVKACRAAPAPPHCGWRCACSLHHTKYGRRSLSLVVRAHGVPDIHPDPRS
jgi:hypothetical protein